MGGLVNRIVDAAAVRSFDKSGSDQVGIVPGLDCTGNGSPESGRRESKSRSTHRFGL
jgi:hypothetical protein